MTVSADGRSVELYRSMRRLPPSQQWKAEAMAKINATPWQPKITEPGEVKPRRRFFVGQRLLLHGSWPTCRHCAGDGGAHSESFRLEIEKIGDKEEARATRFGGRCQHPSTPTSSERDRDNDGSCNSNAEFIARRAPMDIAEPAAEPGRDLNVHMAERRPLRRRELEDVYMTANLAQPASERTYEIWFMRTSPTTTTLRTGSWTRTEERRPRMGVLEDLRHFGAQRGEPQGLPAPLGLQNSIIRQIRVRSIRPPIWLPNCWMDLDLRFQHTV